jgi:flagellar motor switch protein FliM
VRAKVVPYNFSSAGQISTEQLRAISMLNDLFARNLTHNLAAWLRTRFQVNLVSAEQIQFNEFLLRIPEISYVASVRLEPLGALSVLQLDLALAPPMIDLLLGGDGKDGPLRELTDIEESILGSVVEIICRELTVAWQPVGLSFQLRAPPDADPGGAHHRSREDALPELRDSHAAQLGPAEPGLSRRGRQHHSAPADLGLGPAPPPCRRDAGAMGRGGARIRFGCSLQLPAVRLAASALEES